MGNKKPTKTQLEIKKLFEDHADCELEWQLDEDGSLTVQCLSHNYSFELSEEEKEKEEEKSGDIYYFNVDIK